MIDEFILLKKMEGSVTYQDIENMTRAERDYFNVMISEYEKARTENSK